MPLKSELLRILSQIPNIQTVQQRQALLAAVGFDRLNHQIIWEGTHLVFFNHLLGLLGSEGQVSLASFLRNLAARDLNLVGLDDSQRLVMFAERVGSLTSNEWNREFFGAPDTQPSSHTPFILPQLDVSTFTGREEQLQRLEALLLDPGGAKVCSIVGLSGGGGIGKSALACHFATIHRDKFPDGVIGLRVDGNKDVDTIAREFVRRCGEVLDLEDERNATTLMQEVFAHRQMLLIFDNAVDASIRKLRPGGNRCAVIITTRNRTLPSSLYIPDEGAIDLNPLPEEDSLKLLKKILGDDRVNAELSSAYEIIRLLGNLPLALQIVGAALRGRSRSIADYVASLQREKTRLARLTVQGDDELNVEASINLSLELLNEDRQDFFACLCVCAEEGFARRTAMAAGGCEDEWDADDHLNRLYELSLLNYAEIGENRFVLHPLVRVYAENIARERNIFFISQERHAKFLVAWLQSEEWTDENAIAEVAADLDDVILATEWLQTYEAETVQGKMDSYQFVLNLQPLFEQYGYWQKAITLMARFQSWAEQFQDWNAVVRYKMHEARYRSFMEEFEQAKSILYSALDDLAKIEDLDTQKKRKVKVLNVLAGIFQKQGEFKEAIQTFRDEILIEEEIGNKQSLSIVYNRLGKLLQAQNDLDEAKEMFEQSITTVETLSDKLSLIIGLNCLGGVLQQQGKLEEAQKTFEQLIEIDEVQNDQFQLSIGLNRLGGVLQQQGKLEEAQKTFEQQITIDKTQNNQSQLSIGLNRLGGVLQQQGKLEEAQKIFEQQILINEVQNDQLPLSIGLNRLGGVLQQQGKLEEAQKIFEQQITIDKTQNNQSQLSIGLNRLGGVLQQQGKLEEAQKIFEQQILIDEVLDNQLQLSIGLNRLGGVLQQQGKLEEAQKTFEQQIIIDKIQNDQSSLSIGLNCLGGVLQQQGKLEEAQKTFEQQITIDKIQNDQSSLSIGLNRLGGVLQQQGKLEEAQKTFEQQITIDEVQNDQSQLSIGLNRLGGVLQQQGKLEEAQKTFEQQITIDKTQNNQSSLAIGLHNLGRIWKMQGEFEKAETALKQSQVIFEDEKDLLNLAKVMNTLGSVLEKRQKWDEAERILRQSYDLAIKLQDKRGKAIIANSLGQVIARQELEEKRIEETFKIPQMFFRQSIKIGEEINDKKHLAKVHTAMGQALLARENFVQAVEHLSRGFEIDESIPNIRGLKIVTPNLTYALSKLGKAQQALEYCDRALRIAPNHVSFLELHKKIQASISMGTQQISIKTGSILFIQKNKADGFYWGRILPDDGSPNITFNEKYIGSDSLTKLVQGALIEFEVYKGYAKKIRIIEDYEDNQPDHAVILAENNNLLERA
ncbi:tetratricopeptide repeat protein [Vacuolonema iberomarrocanum]|uniref:tetratricopeptide repeat protein n=1 Tax=Vacuolonema iberomarrocanum TaxID=3454632 RepID=UPI001A020F64|nr:tetratricopeptide repeat protein [filamentous cyanobacterium LEGE 07170]